MARADELIMDLEPEELKEKLELYQQEFGKSFGLNELLQLESIRSRALIADAICQTPFMYLDEKAAMHEDLGIPYIADGLVAISEAIERMTARSKSTKR